MDYLIVSALSILAWCVFVPRSLKDPVRNKIRGWLKLDKSSA